MPDVNPYDRKSHLLSGGLPKGGDIVALPSKAGERRGGKGGGAAAPAYAELVAASNFSFLCGASHPEELAVAARVLGLRGLSLCDTNTLSGIVRAHVAAKEAGIAYAVGCRLVFCDATPDIAVWPRDRAAYGRLCRLLTTGNLRAEKGSCHLYLDDLVAWGEGLEMAVLTGPDPAGADCRRLARTLETLKAGFGTAVRLGASCRFLGSDTRRLAALAASAARLGVPLLAVGDALAHSPDRRALQNVLTCIREHVTLGQAGFRLIANAERHLKAPQEMARLFADHPGAIAESVRLFDRLSFSLDELAYEYPEEPAGQSATPQAELERLAWKGAQERYPNGVPEAIKANIIHELDLIGELDYAPYFLTVWDIVRFARSRGILCQGRGSAANSTVCFCLGITEVDPDRVDLLFERFVSAERREPPDIDVDFEHARREEVIQYVYDKYGRDRAGIAATVITYRARSAAREVGKAFGFSEDSVAALSGTVWGASSSGLGEEDARRAGFDPMDPRFAKMLAITGEIIGFPRHLSQHVGGFVITRGRLDEVVPVLHSAMDDRTIIEWDKDDLDALGMLKIDILALGMLTAMKKSLELLETQYGKALSLASIPAEDETVYDMICRADTLGVFQVESRAQMTMLPRLRPRNFYDLVIEVAIVRPGPIQGDMVHPFLRRRQGKETVVYPSPAPEHGPAGELEKVLGKTLGVPLFQEQAMRIAIVAAGFTPAEADRLRRAMATFRRVGTIHTFQAKMVDGMVARGYEGDFADRCFRQIEGFGEYGFPESHAASFALLVYTSCWMKCHYPDVFCAAMLNAQPLGFYAPAQLVRDAREHGVKVLPVDINHSGWDALLEPENEPVDLGAESSKADPGANERVRRRVHVRNREQVPSIRSRFAVRLGLRQIKGLKEADGERLLAARGTAHKRAGGPGYASVRELWWRSGLTRAALEKLAEADAFRSMGLDRRAALWRVRALEGVSQKAASSGTGSTGGTGSTSGTGSTGRTGSSGETLPLFSALSEAGWDPLRAEPAVKLPDMAPGEHVVHDYRMLALSLKAHPVSFIRPSLEADGVSTCARLGALRTGARIRIAGLVLVRQRPGTAKGVIFETLEDETGIANIIVWPKVFQTYREIVMGSRFVAVTGRVQSEQGVIHVVANRLVDLTPLLSTLSEDPATPGIFRKRAPRVPPSANSVGLSEGPIPNPPVIGNQGLARADEVRTPVEEHRERTKPGSRLVRLLKEAPELKADIAKLAHSTHQVMPKGRNFH